MGGKSRTNVSIEQARYIFAGGADGDVYRRGDQLTSNPIIAKTFSLSSTT